MDFALSADQEALRGGVQRFCAGRLALAELRRLEGTGFDRALWSALAELGVFGLRAGATAGGATGSSGSVGAVEAGNEAGVGTESGSGLAEAVLVFEALGRALAPGPILWTHLAAGLIPEAGEGGLVVTGVEVEREDEGASARDARPLLVEHLAAADVLLVLRPDGIERLDARAVASEAKAVDKPLDPFTPVSRVAALPRGPRIADSAAAERIRLEGTVLAAAMLLGIAEETLALATRHANERQQFDRPIGSFQAIKHLLADAFTRQELARASVYAAGVLVDEREEAAARRAAAAAKLIAGEAAMKNARACIQVMGGMGFTWESPAHFFLKRTWVLEHAFGASSRQAESLAQGIGPS